MGTRQLMAIIVAFLLFPALAVAQARRSAPPSCTARPCVTVSAVIAPVVAFEQVFTVERRMTLEAPDGIASSGLTAFEGDPLGGILVAFGGTGGSYRRYSLDGAIVWEVPRASIERTITVPSKIARISESQILLGQMTSEAVIWNEQTKRVERSLTLPVRPTNGSVLGLGSGSVLVELTLEDPTDVGLHVVDAATGRLVRSFFRPTITPFTRNAVLASYGYVSADRRGDTVAAVFAFSDTIYLHHVNGTLLEKIRLPTGSFSPPTEAPTSPDRSAVAAWRSNVGEAAEIFWLPDGSFVVEYQRVVGPNLRRGRSFLMLSRAGDGIFDLHGFDSTIRIVDRQGLFYFEDPQFKQDRSRMVVARLKARD